MKIRATITFIIIATLFTACKKEKIKGCKVSYATNYKANAEEEDGSCAYESKLIFWQNQSSATSWDAAGVTAWNFYVDGQFIGSSSALTYYNSSPACSSNGLASVTKSLGNSKSKSFSYSIKAQDGVEWYSGSVTLDGSTCAKKQILF